MTIEQLIEILKTYPKDMNVAIRAKDDYLLTNDMFMKAKPYFGNCNNGMKWIDENLPLNEDGDRDWDKIPEFLIIEL